MCGIYGMVDAYLPVDSASLSERRDRLKHRGPDDAGIWLSPERNVGFAHRRLAILDLSANGHQPMASADGRCTMVFNGEIYNFRELRSELIELGFRFLGGSDSEVVLAAYQAWGEDCLSRFNGMFALAIHDAGSSCVPPSIFFARDRTGKKPLYYLQESGRFQFASELKAIDSPREIDAGALNYYLALGYVPHDFCLIKGVKKLPPAHAARLDLRSLELKLWKYWSLPVNNPGGAEGEELADQAESLLMSSVQLRMLSDVPLGVLLSGGLDSSLIAAAAARQSSQPIKTFTVAFPGTRQDEAPFAKCVADYLDSEHHVLEVERPSLDILDEFSRLIDEPIADSSLLPSFVVSKLTRQHVTVALGGDGGDELFGGYSDYPISLADQKRFGWIPSPLLHSVALLAASLPAGVKGRNRLSSLRGGPLQQMIWGSPYFDIELRKRILNPEQLAELGEEIDAPERWLLSLYLGGKDPVDCMTRTHFNSILPDDFLVKVDRASMMNSLEVRCPFLDHRLVEFAFEKIPSQWKVQGSETRRVERILGKRMLPPELDTKRKQGFSIPLDEWLRATPTVFFEGLGERLSTMLRPDKVSNLLNGLNRGRANGSRIYSLLMLDFARKNNV